MRIIYLLSMLLLCVLASCSTGKGVVGEYEEVDRGLPRIVHLDADSTGYFTWWTDIQLKNKGTWSITNDTILFVDRSPLSKGNRRFVVQGNKLIDDKGTVYKRMNALQRKRVYRDR